MSNTNAATTVWSAPNYLGTLYRIGANSTPFLNMIGGLQGSSVRIVQGMQFALAQTYGLEAASQPERTEAQSVTAPTAWTYDRTQDVNTVQLFDAQVSASYMKLASSQWLTADSTTGLIDVTDVNPVQNELQFQTKAAMEQIATNVEYTFLNGSYVQSTDATTAGKCCGIITAATTSTVAASAGYLTKNLLNQLLRTMYANGAKFTRPVIFCNAFQMQLISDIWGFAPARDNVGGVAIDTVITPFCRCGVVLAPRVPAATLLVADVSVCKPVFWQVPGKGVLFYEPLAKVGGAESGLIYGLIGLKKNRGLIKSFDASAWETKVAYRKAA